MAADPDCATCNGTGYLESENWHEVEYHDCPTCGTDMRLHPCFCDDPEPQTVTTKKPRIPKPAWHRQPCPDCGRPLIFKRDPGHYYRPHSETMRWNYRHRAVCRCGFEAMMTMPGKPVYPEKKR